VISFMSQLDNGIPIKPFIGDANDKELYQLLHILIELSVISDVRSYLREKFCVAELYSIVNK
jgi:TFIIF-interacting CTD phosphatase-like protein